MPRRLLAYPELHNELRTLERMYGKGRQGAIPTSRDFHLGDAYLMSAHASLEFYIEEMCRRAVYRSVWRYARGGGSNSVLDALRGCYYHANVGQLPKGAFVFMSGAAAVEKATQWYTKRVDDNQGVKRNNVLALFLPLGFKEGDFDEVWLAALDSFGSHRGDVAHGRPISTFGARPVHITSTGQSVQVTVWTPKATRTRQRFTTKTVRRDLQQLLGELLAWDRRLVAACN